MKLLLNHVIIGITTSFERSVLAQTSGGVEGACVFDTDQAPPPHTTRGLSQHRP